MARLRSLLPRRNPLRARPYTGRPVERIALAFVPLAALLLFARLESVTNIVLGIVAAMGVGLVASRRPDITLMLLIPGLLTQLALSGWLNSIGVPAPLLRAAESMEAVAWAGIAIAAVLLLRAAPGGRRYSPTRAERVAFLIVPSLVLFFAPLPESFVQLLIGMLVALGVVLLAARRPDIALVLLVPWLVSQLTLAAWLYKVGVPSPLLRPMAGMKEVALAGVIIAAVRAVRAEGRRLDTLDKVGIAFILLSAAYLLAPQILVGRDAVLATDARLVAFRQAVSFIALLLAVRHLPLTPAQGKLFIRVAMLTGLAVALVGLYEWAFSSSWDNFAVNTVGINRYRIEVLNSFVPRPWTVQYVDMLAGREITRPGSVLYEPVFHGMYLLIGLGVSVALVARGRLSARSYLIPGLITITLLLTLTRAAQLAAIVPLLVAVAVRGRLSERLRSGEGRIRLVAGAATIAFLLLPLAASSGALTRIAGSGEDDSSEIHSETSSEAVARLARRPLGYGLGSGSASGIRFSVTGQFSSHNSYLQVGNEVGVPGMVLFIAVLLLALSRLRAIADGEGDGSAVALAALAAGAALTFAGIFHDAWIILEVTWTVSALMGVGLAMARVRAAPQERDQALAMAR